MWGYSIAAAALGIDHKSSSAFQIEPGAIMSPIDDKFYIYHYTYGVELTLDGKPQARREITPRSRVEISRGDCVSRSHVEIVSRLCRDCVEMTLR